MRSVTIPLALAALLAAGCHHGPGVSQGGAAASHLTALGLFGGANINVNQYLCAGRIALNNGSGAVKDSCFSGESNIVLCTDVTGANAVRCTPAPGELSIGGTGTDVISYVRVK